MKEIVVKINNASGLHARPAAQVVNAAKEFQSNIFLKKGEREVNLKSLISLLSLGISQNEEIIIKAVGDDEEKAVEALKNVITNLKD